MFCVSNQIIGFQPRRLLYKNLERPERERISKCELRKLLKRDVELAKLKNKTTPAPPKPAVQRGPNPLTHTPRPTPENDWETNKPLSPTAIERRKALLKEGLTGGKETKEKELNLTQNQLRAQVHTLVSFYFTNITFNKYVQKNAKPDFLDSLKSLIANPKAFNFAIEEKKVGGAKVGYLITVQGQSDFELTIQVPEEVNFDEPYFLKDAVISSINKVPVSSFDFEKEQHQQQMQWEKQYDQAFNAAKGDIRKEQLHQPDDNKMQNSEIVKAAAEQIKSTQPELWNHHIELYVDYLQNLGTLMGLLIESNAIQPNQVQWFLDALEKYPKNETEMIKHMGLLQTGEEGLVNLKVDDLGQGRIRISDTKHPKDSEGQAQNLVIENGIPVTLNDDGTTTPLVDRKGLKSNE